MANDKTLNMKEAAKYFGVTRDTFRSWWKKGKIDIPYARLGKAYMFRESDLETLYQKIRNEEFPSEEGK